MESAVMDRFADDLAVRLIRAAPEPLDVPRVHLPSEAQPGDWLQVAVVDDQFVRVELDSDATRTAQRRSATKLARLRRGDHLRDDLRIELCQSGQVDAGENPPWSRTCASAAERNYLCGTSIGRNSSTRQAWRRVSRLVRDVGPVAGGGCWCC